MTNGAFSVRLWERLVGKHRTREEKEIFQADIVGDGFDHHAVAETPSEALFLAAQRWRFHDEATDITPIKFDEIRARIAAGETRTDWAHVNALTDDEIEAAMRDDPDWKDHIDEDWSKAELVIPKEAMDHLVQVAVDAVAEVDWVRGLFGSGYGCVQEVMRDALTAVLSAAPVSQPEPQCCMCGKKGLSTAEHDGGGECELTDGRWTCSQECWERAVDPQPVAWRYKATYADGNPVPGWQFSETPSLLGLYEPLFAYQPDLTAENARLREALAPFAAEADEHDGASAIFSAEVPIAWLRAARAAHKGGAA